MSARAARPLRPSSGFSGALNLPADVQRRTILPYLHPVVDQPYVVVALESLLLPSAELMAEIDSEFGVCLAIRLTGRYPAIGVIRQIPTGFREYWRSLGPAARPVLRRVQAFAEADLPTPVFWRLSDGSFAELQLGGWNRQHRVWYARLEPVASDAVRFRLVDDTTDDSESYPPVASALA